MIEMMRLEEMDRVLFKCVRANYQAYLSEPVVMRLCLGGALQIGE